jgi:hypothetical protein
MGQRPGDSRLTCVPTQADLARWVERQWTDGVQVNELAPLEHLVVRTANSIYDITVLAPGDGDLMVRGGNFFPMPARARLAGACLGGSFLKLRGIYVGFSMEIWRDGVAVVTSPVRSIARVLEDTVQ